MLACLIMQFKLMLVPAVLLVIKELSDLLTGFLTFRKTGDVLGAEWHGKVTTTIETYCHQSMDAQVKIADRLGKVERGEESGM